MILPKTITFILAFLILVISISERDTELISHAQREGPSILGGAGTKESAGSARAPGAASANAATTKTHAGSGLHSNHRNFGMVSTCTQNIPSFAKWTNLGFNSWTVTIDLGWQNHVCGIRIDWFNQFGSPYEYIISTSSNGTTYYTAYQGTHPQGNSEMRHYYFSDRLVRYVKINVHGNLGNPIRFIDIYGQ
jgi:hypothetical protein